MIKRVACAISGGVDSAVAALILKKKGFEVTGVFMKNWDDQDENGTCQLNLERDLDDARAACKHLQIDFVEVSFVREYWNDVFSSLLEDYENGMTPNGDVFCNRYIKFGAFYDYALNKLGAHAIATGHYARTTFGTCLEKYQPGKKNNLLKAVDPIKDQTLFLSQIKQEPLQRTMFPVGNLFKAQVREIAHEYGFTELSKKGDSRGICFIGKRKFTDFITDYIPNKRGPFIDIDTEEIIGWHEGVHHYTVGQRCRLENHLSRYYVLHRDPHTQMIRAVIGAHRPIMHQSSVITLEPHWIADEPNLSKVKPFYCMFRFQHCGRSIPCKILLNDNGGLCITLGSPMRALTPGQIAVFYKDLICLGSAKIAISSWEDFAAENNIPTSNNNMSTSSVSSATAHT